ncbi:MAG: TolC family outer membrane protein [Gallionella sp.]
MKNHALKLIVVTLLAVSGSAGAADLLEIFHTAQTNDPVYGAARATLEAGKEKLPQNRSNILPSVNLSANSTMNRVNAQYLPASGFRSGDFNYNSNGYGVNLVQPLFRWQNWMSYTEAQLQVAMSEEQFRIAQQDLILRVSKAYFDVLIAQESVHLAEAQKIAISEQLEQAKRNFEVGSATITDTLEAQARFDQTSAQQISVQNDLEIRRRTLQQLIDTMPAELKPLGKEFKPESPQPTEMEKWVEDALVNNSQLAVARASSELADKEVARNRGGHYPTLDMVANYTRNYPNGGNLGQIESTSKSVGVQLNLSLFQGGMINSRLREAQANRQRAAQELENARRTVATQTRQAYLGVVSGIARVEALQQAMASSESVLEASKLGQEVGVRTNLDVLNAQQQLYSTRRDLYQAQYNYLYSQLQLKASVGTLDEDYLASINGALH